MSQTSKKSLLDHRDDLQAADVLDANQVNEHISNNVQVLRALRKSADWGINNKGQIMRLCGQPKPRENNPNIIDFPIVYAGFNAEYYFTHWNMGSMVVTNEEKYLKALPKGIAGLTWYQIVEKFKTVAMLWEGLDFIVKKTGPNNKYLSYPAFMFDDAKVKKLLSEEDFKIYQMDWEDLQDTSKREVRQHRSKRGALIESVRQHDYGKYILDAYLEPRTDKRTNAEINSRGRAYVQGELIIHPMFTVEQEKELKDKGFEFLT